MQCMEFPEVFPYPPFEVCRVCSNVPSFVPTLAICVSLSLFAPLSVLLKVSWFFFKEPPLCFLDLLYYFFCFLSLLFLFSISFSLLIVIIAFLLFVLGSFYSFFESRAHIIDLRLFPSSNVSTDCCEFPPQPCTVKLNVLYFHFYSVPHTFLLPWDFLFELWLCKSVLFSSTCWKVFLSAFCCRDPVRFPLWWRNTLGMISIVFVVLRGVSWSMMPSLWVCVPWTFEKCQYHAWVGQRVLRMLMRSCWLAMV